MPEFYDRHRKKFSESYRKWERWFRQKPVRIMLLKIAGRVLTGAVYVAYPLLLCLLTAYSPERLVRAIIVPLAVFLVTTAVRKGINAPRPYEYSGITPLIPKSTKGNSCPSRHTACAIVIALAWCYGYPLFGIEMLVIAAAIAISRPLMGVHYPLDVLFGAAIALVIGGVGFFLIP